MTSTKQTNRRDRRSPIANPYEVLIQGVVDYAIYMLDPDGRVASWNPGAEKIKGYSEDEILGEHFSRFYTPEDRAAGVPERALRMAAETGRFTAEAWRCRKDGSRFWAHGGHRPGLPGRHINRLRQDHPRYDRAARRRTSPRWRASVGFACWSRV